MCSLWSPGILADRDRAWRLANWRVAAIPAARSYAIEAKAGGRLMPALAELPDLPRVHRSPTNQALQDVRRAQIADHVLATQRRARSSPSSSPRLSASGRYQPYIEGPEERARRRARERQPKWQASHRQALARHAERYPFAVRATKALQRAVKSGRVIKAKHCQAESCTSTKCIEAHHWSYAPEHRLDVLWLCPLVTAKVTLAASSDRRQASPDTTAQFRRGHKLQTPSPLQAVRRHCLDCCGGSAKEVALCPARKCPLWTMRFNRRPNPAEYAGDPTPLHPAEIPITLGEFAAKGMRTLEAVRRRCIDCSGGSPIEPRNCKFTGCDLWPYRLGKNPNRIGKGYFAQGLPYTGLSRRTSHPTHPEPREKSTGLKPRL